MTEAAEALRAEVARIRQAIGEETHEIEQRIAHLFPDEFPKYPEDWDAGDDLCVGEHVVVTLVEKVCVEVERLRKRRDTAHREMQRARAEVRRKEAVLRKTIEEKNVLADKLGALSSAGRDVIVAANNDPDDGPTGFATALSRLSALACSEEA